MTSDVFAMLLDRRASELSKRALTRNLTRPERAELDALKSHRDKAPAITHRIRVLAAKNAQPSLIGLLFLRFSRRFKANIAELEALAQYGHSYAAWEISFLKRKKAVQKLTAIEETELQYLQLYHDSPTVLRLTQLKVKETFDQLTLEELRELTELHRGLYRQEGIPNHLLELFVPSSTENNPKESI